MEHLGPKTIDDAAKQYIEYAYQNGISVILILKFLEECNYDCTMTIIHKTLWNVNIYPNNSNCSSDSLVWRRFLTNIFETYHPSTLEQFQTIALQDAINYYNIDNDTLKRHWDGLIEFQNQFLQEIENPPNAQWTIRGLIYFGFTFGSLANKLRSKNILIDTEELHNIYNTEIEGHNFSIGEFKLRPKWLVTSDIKKFWKSCDRIGQDYHTINKWSEIFIGMSVSEWRLRHIIRS